MQSNEKALNNENNFSTTDSSLSIDYIQYHGQLSFSATKQTFGTTAFTTLDSFRNMDSPF